MYIYGMMIPIVCLFPLKDWNVFSCTLEIVIKKKNHCRIPGMLYFILLYQGFVQILILYKSLIIINRDHIKYSIHVSDYDINLVFKI